MGSINDALKRAEQARERLRTEPAVLPLAPDASEVQTGQSTGEMASDNPLTHALQRAALENSAGNVPDVASPAADTEVLANPVSQAMRRAPASAADSTALRVAEGVIEHYEPRQRLALDPRLVVYHDRAGAIAEQYRHIRARLLSDVTKPFPQMLVITSSVAGEGKTVTTLNLGLSLTEMRSIRVLLMDGDLQHGALSRYMKHPGPNGVAEILATEQAPEPFIQATPWNNLFVLPAGGVGPAGRSTELLKRPGLRSTLRHLRSIFDVVLIDTPPAMRYPDAGIMGAAGDGVILAVELRKTSRAVVQRTVRLFHAMNIPLRGCVLTGQ